MSDLPEVKMLIELDDRSTKDVEWLKDFLSRLGYRHQIVMSSKPKPEPKPFAFAPWFQKKWDKVMNDGS